MAEKGEKKVRLFYFSLLCLICYRLNKLLKKEDTADSKADELKIKLNILRAFAKKKHDSVTETPEAKEDISKTAREEL